MTRVIPFLLALFLGNTTAAMAERPVTVFAAASLGGVLEEIAQDYSSNVVLDYGGSGILARQVAAGAPADLVVLANPAWMGWLVDQGVVKANTVRFIAGNSLVVIGQRGVLPLKDVSELPARLGKDRLAMGHRDAVPAGFYARQWMQHIDLWEKLSAKLAETDNVRAALALVAQGQLPYGVVYASDVRAVPGVEVVYAVPPQSHDTILYPAAALSPKGAAFLAHLMTPKSLETFVAYGFRRPTP